MSGNNESLGLEQSDKPVLRIFFFFPFRSVLTFSGLIDKTDKVLINP